MVRALGTYAQGLEWEWRIIGDGPELGKLRRLVNEYGLDQRVTFVGGVSRGRVLDELDSADVFLLTSKETFGLAYLEALARGLIVVGAKGYGIDGIVFDGREAFLADPDSVASIAQVVGPLCAPADWHHIRKIAQRGLVSVAAYGAGAKAQQYLDTVLSVVSEAPAKES